MGDFTDRVDSFTVLVYAIFPVQLIRFTVQPTGLSPPTGPPSSKDIFLFASRLSRYVFQHRFCDLVRAGGDDALYKVRVLPVVVLRVRCPVVLAPPHAYHQVVLPEQFDERVAAGHPAAVAQAIRYHPVQLRASYARIVPAQFACGLDDDTLDGIVGEVMVAALVERLPAITKQPAEGIQGRAREPAA